MQTLTTSHTILFDIHENLKESLHSLFLFDALFEIFIRKIDGKGKLRFSWPISHITNYMKNSLVMVNLRVHAFSDSVSYHPLPWSSTWKIEKCDAVKVSVHYKNFTEDRQFLLVISQTLRALDVWRKLVSKMQDFVKVFEKLHIHT